ncbi:MAG: FimV/HubP family polar landmark protein [Gammaproteobacteria bacterium]
MFAKLLSRAFVALAAFPAAAVALGLGDIRLNSSLNAPLDAEIELIGATPEELASLRPEVASRETFTRYGLDWPAFLGSVTLSRTRAADGSDVIRVRSTEAITEPFVTFLVEVNWARGRLVREYTMLLDPPLYTPGMRAADAAPVAAPSVSGSPRQGAIERAPPPPAGEATSRGAPDDVSVPAAAGDTYTVARGDTLSGLANRLASGDRSIARQWMLAVYQANPEAFDDSMNVLRAGAVLRLPDQATVASVSVSEANAEVRRQYAAWRGTAAGAAAGEPGRLRLVTPTDAGTGAGDSGASQAEVESLQGQVRDLESQLAESRRLLELRNAELAQLQARLAAAAEGSPDAAQAPSAAEPPVADTAPPPVDTEGAPDVEAAVEPPVAADDTAEPAPEPAVAEPAPAAAAGAEAAAEDSGSSILDTITGLWWLLALGLLAVLGFFGLRMWRSRKEAEFDDSLGRLAAAGADTIARETSIAPSMLRQPAAAAGPREQAAFLVEESGAREQPRFEEKPRTAAPPARSISSDDTISSETAINLDQGDPLAEADFHMAYGLYDQAADLVRMSIAREPERRDLKLKLLEVFFVWGNKDQFLQTARELADTRGKAVPGEWEKIVIMGKQLAPDDALFAGGGPISGAAAGGVDLDLEGGQNRIDFDVFGEPMSPPAGAIDLDFGSALDATSESPTATQELGGSQTTREMTAKMQRDAEPLTADFDNSPTAEQPGLYSEDSTVRSKLEGALKREGGPDQTAELAIDDLGLDLGSLDTASNRALNETPETPTLVAGLDERSREIMEDAELRGAADTGQYQIGSEEATLPPSSVRAIDGGAQTSNDPTQAMPRGGIDFDIGDFEPAQTSGNGHGIDLDVGPAMQPDTSFTATQKLAADDLALPDLEPVTMSEVGTKLDLARAYMDMGDPEGARNILEEVLQEGSVAQKQEAQRLIESLPG